MRTIYPEFVEKNDPALRKLFLEENPCFMQLIDKLGEPVVAKKLTKQDRIKQNYLSNLNQGEFFFIHSLFTDLKISDQANDDQSKRLIQKQVPSMYNTLVLNEVTCIFLLIFCNLVSTKVSNLKFILRRLLKIDISRDFSLIITCKVSFLNIVFFT